MANHKKTFVNRYSISKILRDKKKSNDYFELMIGNLTLEELIALKLEIAFRTAQTPLMGIPIWKTTTKFVKDAIFKFALSAAGTKKGAKRLLGMNNKQFDNYLQKLEIISYYKEKGDDSNWRKTKSNFSKSTSRQD